MNEELFEDVMIEQTDKNIKSKRQEFEDATRRELMLRANLRCCNPKCRRLLVAVDKKTDELVVIGEGAHIYPAKENGPRYDKSHSDKDFIKSEKNGLWLCPTCHELVDKRRTIANYPASKLLEWKKKSETEYSDCLENPTIDFKLKFYNDYFREIDFDIEKLTNLQKTAFYYCIFNQTDFTLHISADEDGIQLSEFIVLYENLRNWWNNSQNKFLRNEIKYEIKHINHYNPFSDSRYDWEEMLDKFLHEFTGDKNLEAISQSDSKYFSMKFDLIKTVVFKDDENKLVRFFELFE